MWYQDGGTVPSCVPWYLGTMGYLSVSWGISVFDWVPQYLDTIGISVYHGVSQCTSGYQIVPRSSTVYLSVPGDTTV